MTELLVRAVIFATVLFLAHGCPNGGRRNRQVSTVAPMINEKLAKFFGTRCPSLSEAADGTALSLQSIVDFVLRDTKWFDDARNNECTKDLDNSECWIEAIYYLLDTESEFVEPTGQCIQAWENDQKKDRQKRRITNFRRSAPLTSKRTAFTNRFSKGIKKFAKRYPSIQRFNGTAISLFLRDHYTYCRGIPDISFHGRKKFTKILVRQQCPKSGSNGAWRNNLTEVFDVAVRKDGPLGKAIEEERESANLPAIDVPRHRPSPGACNPEPQLPCGNSQATGFACSRQVLKIPGHPPIPCCENPNPKNGEPNCVASKTALDRQSSTQQRKIGSRLEGANDLFKENLIEKPTQQAMKHQASIAARSLRTAGVEEVGEKKTNIDDGQINQRSLGFSFGGLGGLLGGGALFPECPVHVKFCYRVPCGGYNRRFLDNNPKQCLSDPRCCYDYKLAFMRRISPKFYGDAPVCYYGPTSKQWVYLTNFFKPWNPWYTSYILKVFKELFNTNAFKFGGNFICEIDFQKKAYPVGAGSKLECDLVSGCWDDSFPVGLQCSMAGSFAQQLFGQNEVYPSLFTNDPSDTRCSSNWFDFGPKAYNRLPCAIGPKPDSFFDMIYKWCPSTDCCLNYANLGSDGFSSLATLQLIQGLGQGGGGGGGGFPGIFPSILNLGGLGGLGGGLGQTPLDSNVFAYLFAGGNSDLSDLFCPYRTFFSSSLFPDFDDDIEGCCDIPTCYHKKKLVGGRTFPPPQPPTLPPLPPSQGVWGAWGPCNAQCGQFGTRTRACLVNGRQTSTNYCVGSNSQQCQGFCQPPPAPSYRWSEFRVLQPCNVACGSGFEVWGRQCLGLGSQVVSDNLCQGSSQSYNRQCTRSPCTPPPPPPPSYRWSEFRLLQPCNVACGSGSEVWGRQCLGPGSQVVSDNSCQGSSQRHRRQCTRPPCTPPPPPPSRYHWTGWGIDCSQCRFPQQQVTQYRACFQFVNGRFVLVEPQSLCGPQSTRLRQVSCSQHCPGQG